MVVLNFHFKQQDNPWLAKRPLKREGTEEAAVGGSGRKGRRNKETWVATEFLPTLQRLDRSDKQPEQIAFRAATGDSRLISTNQSGASHCLPARLWRKLYEHSHH